MPTLVCVPIMVPPVPEWRFALERAAKARDAGADLVEFRLDDLFTGSGDAVETDAALELVAKSPLPCIVTCRPTWEGGNYDGDDTDRIALFERLGTAEHPPAYIDVELAAYTRSANLRQKVNLAVQHPAQQRDVRTRLILSIHDFDGRPADLTRRLAAAYAEDAAAVVKVAYRARSLRDNLELFDLLANAHKPTIALGMGEFGLASRVLAPKFGGFLTFASLGREEITAPGQPTIGELLDLYRFRSIRRSTRVFGVIGWPVSHSLSPLVHNAGFEAAGVDAVYLPLPVAGDENDPHGTLASLKATLGDLTEHNGLGFAGASVTIPHKRGLVTVARTQGWSIDENVGDTANTLVRTDAGWSVHDTDWPAVRSLLVETVGDLAGKAACVFGTGGVARSIAGGLVDEGAEVLIVSRSPDRAEALASGLSGRGAARATTADDAAVVAADVFINATPVGMTGGPDAAGSAIAENVVAASREDAVFFDTVYRPVRTPMVELAEAHGRRTIDGLSMFVRQAAAQFTLFTGRGDAPRELFRRVCEETLDAAAAT